MGTTMLRTTRSRLSAEQGFTMVVVLGVLLVTSLLLTAVFFALQGEIQNGTTDLATKRAYAAATAGVNAYLYQLNQDPNYWNTCSHDTQGTPVSVPGSSDGATYTFAPIYANGNTTCTTNVINSLIDNTTGTIRMVFTGTAGTRPVVTRAVVVSFRMNSPLDFLWYTHFESVDDNIPGYSDCGVFYRTPGGRDTNCNIVWVSADMMKGPTYTDDQYLINTGASPTFGRQAGDLIESSAPGSAVKDVCSGSNCQSAVFKGTRIYQAKQVPTPSDNSELLTDAQNYGNVYSGTTTISINGTTATAVSCVTATSCVTHPAVNLANQPIIYVTNAPGCTPPVYTGTVSSYPTDGSGHFTGCSGDAYVSTTSSGYTTPVTIGAANNVVIDGNLTTTSDGNGNPTGSATMGLVANEFVRVMHGCSSNQLTNPIIDAAILALNHSFIVDNWTCGGSSGNLTVHGAIAQYFRGPVGQVGSGGGVSNGYAKNYSYDDRLANILPPYLFDISNSGWHVSRETICTAGSTNTTYGCQAPG
jgi:type II secretory pathway pseudopilin PulG